MESGVITYTLDCIKLLVGPGSKLGKGQLESFKARARTLPSMLFTNGLAYTLVYVSSRSSYEVVEVGLASENCSDLQTRLENRLMSAEKEEVGYILYGALLAHLLRHARLTNARSFDELVKKAMEDALLNQRALTLAEWIKRFAEAYITG